MDDENQLPENIENALKDRKNFEKVCDIARRFQIKGEGDEGIDKLDTIFEKVLNGSLSQNKVAGEIKKEFGFSEELSRDIAKEMETQIFSNYKEGLDMLYPKTEGEPTIPGEDTIDTIIGKAEERAKTEFPSLKISTEEKTSQIENTPEVKKEKKIQVRKKTDRDEINEILKGLSEELESAKTEGETLGKKIKKE
ncbi:MAG: hypothetical protein PHI88_00150 [Candidatus Pacebacteria bacterium]|nr:hypothetical protein [Candidatus Paceibacterota bacterium]